LGFCDEGVTVSGARVCFVEIPVDKPVEAHSHGSCAHDAAEDPSELRGGEVAVSCGDHRAQREGERENGVRKADELTESLCEG